MEINNKNNYSDYKDFTNINILFNASNIAILLVNIDYTIVELNNEMARRFNRSADSMKGTRVYDYLPLELAASRKIIFDKVIITGEPYTEIDERETIWNYSSFYPLKDASGKVVQVAIYAVDITRKHTEDLNLKRSQELFNKTVNSLADYIHVIDRNFNVLLANEACINQNIWLGFPSDIINKNLLEVYPFIIPDIQKEYNTVFENGEILCTQEKISFNGTEYYSETKKIPLFENGSVNRIITSIKDISESKAFEKELKEALVTKDKFLSILAHDLINPITAVLNVSEILKNDYDSISSEKQLQYINAIYNSLKGTTQLLENLLTWSRSQRDQIAYCPEKIVVKDLIEDSVSIIANAAINKEIKIIIQGNDSNVILADKEMLGTVIRNLLSNAIKFSKRGGEILVEHSVKDKGITEISVKDSGMGIAEKNLKKLLNIDEDFTTLGTEKEKGTGLGLILCQEFLKKHNSSLAIRSKEGEGSTFSFVIASTD